jgi:hypothetical protein
VGCQSQFSRGDRGFRCELYEVSLQLEHQKSSTSDHQSLCDQPRGDLHAGFDSFSATNGETTREINASAQSNAGDINVVYRFGEARQHWG